MINLPAITAMNSAAVLLLIIVFVNAHRTVHTHQSDETFFLLMLVMAILQAVIQTVSCYTTGGVFFGSYIINLILDDLLYINNAVFCYLWVLYVYSKVFQGNMDRMKRYIILSIPCLLVVLGALINLFTPLFFVIDPVTNVYSRTSLYFLPNLTAIFYLVYGCAMTWRYRKQGDRYLFFPAIVFMIPILSAALAEYYFQALNILWIGAAISLTSIYISLQNQMTYTDPLSGLYSRQYLTFYLQEELKHSGENMLAGIMMDMDQFKKINDTYGHLMGDKAITSAGKVLRNAVQRGTLAFRFAGDEFIVLQHVSAEEEILKTIKIIQECTSQFNEMNVDSYQISFSIGYTISKNNDTMDDFFGRMDDAMYEEKKKKYIINDRRHYEEDA